MVGSIVEPSTSDAARNHHRVWIMSGAFTLRAFVYGFCLRTDETRVKNHDLYYDSAAPDVLEVLRAI